MQILIVGAGAVGSFFGARLALARHQVTLVGRERLVTAVREAGGLRLLGPDGRPQLVAGVQAAATVGQALAGRRPYDLTLLTVKAYDTSGAVAELLATGAAGPFLTLQNGVGNEEALAEAFGDAAVLSGATDTPVSAPAPGQVQVHRARYKIGLAPVGSAGAVAHTATAFAGAGFDVALYADYRSLKWTKLLMNMLANAGSAILDWTPAQVMADPVAARLEARAWQEALIVMASAGIRPVTLAGYPLGLFAPFARRLPPSWLARLLRGFVAGGRGSKMPSLHMALTAGRPSEVAWLNGAVASHGARAGLPTPVNTLYTQLLTDLTRDSQSWPVYRGQPARVAALIG